MGTGNIVARLLHILVTPPKSFILVVCSIKYNTKSEKSRGIESGHMSIHILML